MRGRRQVRYRDSPRTHSWLVSQILNDLSTDEVVKIPVSCGYHCTSEMPWVCPLERRGGGSSHLPHIHRSLTARG